VRAWDGIRDALEFGDQCLQPPSPDYELLRSGWDQPGRASENCLNLNIWTPAINDDGKRPVMVNMHGGGWTVGNGNSAGRSGEAFARYHDIVRVNVNHRLGIFGFSNMAELLGPDFAGSGTVGIQDIVLALQWVRDNIAAFGGDPENVTIFGVSGGGGKVSTLMAMPAAKGLYHRASVESGSMLMGKPPEPASEAATKLFAALDIPAENASDILALTGEQLMAGYMRMYPDGGLLTAGIAPVVDGVNLPRHPFHPDAPEVSSDIPMLIGTTATESSIFPAIVGGPPFGISWEDVAKRIPHLIPPGLALSADEILAKARELMPKASPTEVLFKMTTEGFFRRPAIRQAELAAERPAPVYMWRIDWPVPVDGGKWGSPHGLSVPLVMDTVAATPAMFGDGIDVATALSAKMSAAWAQFARTGKPDTSEIPAWPTYDAQQRQTMIFDATCHVASDPDGEFRKMFGF
jgi:para-nitrobenzyl esterase